MLTIQKGLANSHASSPRRAIVEFTLAKEGYYQNVPYQFNHATEGAVGASH
ncbi:hypothetical protein [Neobacillus soli]|uniref:hypothetical protein n=1 Tax=Neobacillus soli TaxID=220688 RepID=UPI0014708EBE|nr:hypothetical protein [Neobacillus soli]